MRSFVLAAAVALGLLAAAPAHADPPQPVQAQAQQQSLDPETLRLFERGRQLVKDGKCEEAVPVFIELLGHQQTVGTLLNLAECYRRLDRRASAWTRFLEAESLARRVNDSRADDAHGFAAALEPTLAHLTITLAAGARAPDLAIKLDGVVVTDAVGKPLPVDVGQHVVEATAPGREPRVARVVVGRDGEADRFTIDPLATTAPKETTRIVEVVRTTNDGRAQRTVGIVVGAAGVIALGVGAVFGLVATCHLSDAKAACHGSYPTCSPGDEGPVRDAESAARDTATVSTIGFVAGGVLLAGGVALYLTAPRGQKTATVGFTPGGVVVRSAW